MLIISFVFLAAYDGSDGLAFERPSIAQMTLRLLCCYLFHLGNYKDVTDSYRRLKYLRYNPSHFASELLNPAFVVTIYQFVAAFTCELVNIIYLCR